MNSYDQNASYKVKVDKKISMIKCSSIQTLNKIRFQLNLNNSHRFVYDNAELDIEIEEEMTINDIVNKEKNLITVVTIDNHNETIDLSNQIQNLSIISTEPDIKSNPSNKNVINKEVKNPLDSKTPNSNISLKSYSPNEIPGSKLLKKEGKIRFYSYPSENLSGIDEVSKKVIIMLGQTGSGKSTLINSLVNYINGVRIEDEYRYQMVVEETNKSQAHSQTSDVIIYNIKSKNGIPALQLIDTPGFGDTRGLEQDKIIMEKIEYLFTNKINILHAVCFVAISSCARLTVNQKYIFNRIIDLFGKDIGEIFIPMLTFCDGNKPLILDALTEKDSVFEKIRLYLKDPWFLKFNNSAFFSVEIDNFTKMFWELGNKNYDDFFIKLSELKPKSLDCTRDVMNERRKLENYIKSIQNNSIILLNQMENIRIKIDIIKKNKGIMNSSKNYTITEKVPKITKVDLNPGIHTTNCLVCNRTCHENCQIPDNNNKKDCIAMELSGYCKICPGKCYWDKHKNLPYIFKLEMIDNKVTLEDLKRQHYDSQSKVSVEEQILQGLVKEYQKVMYQNIQNTNELCNSINKLKKISLSENNYESYVNYLDLMMQSEKDEKRPGFLERINSITQLKDYYTLLEKAYSNSNQLNDSYLKFQKDYLDKLFEDKIKEENNCLIF